MGKVGDYPLAAAATGLEYITIKQGTATRRIPLADIIATFATASDIPFTPAGSIAATDVQAAIAELDTEKQPLDTDLTALAAINVAAGDANGILHVNAAGDGYDVAADLEYGSTGTLTHSLSDNGATAGPIFKKTRISTTPAANDVLAEDQFIGKDSAANDTVYATIRTIIESPTDGVEAGLISFSPAPGLSGGVEYRSSGEGPIVFAGYDSGASNQAVYYMELHGSCADGNADGIYLKMHRGSLGTPTVVGVDDNQLGLNFQAYSGAAAAYRTFARIDAAIDGTPDSAADTTDMPGRLAFHTTPDGASTALERMRITNVGEVVLLTPTEESFWNNATTGQGASFCAYSSGFSSITRASGEVLALNRLVDDGPLMSFRQDGTNEGDITVSGTTVSLTGGHLTRWTQWDGIAPADLPRGTILSNADAMCEWFEATFNWVTPGTPERVQRGEVTPAVPERTATKRVPHPGPAGPATIDYNGRQVAAVVTLCANDQLNRMIVSNVVGDRNVAGVLQDYHEDDGEPNVAQSGDFVIRINGSVTVQRGDLIESNGDGTGRVQDDDIVRSKTIAKVTSAIVSRVYDDGSYLVPCILMAGG